jgi:hypothetical protein
MNSDKEQTRYFGYSINPDEALYQKGECLTFKVDSVNYGAGVIVDYSKDEGGQWYGLCFTQYLDSKKPTIEDIKKSKFMGRKVRSTLDAEGYFSGLDVEFINDSLVKTSEKIKSVGRINFDKTKLRYGSEAATNKLTDMIGSFHCRRERRILPPDDYRDMMNLKLRKEEYLPVVNYIK